MRFAGMSLVLLTLTSALAAQEPTADELLRAVERKLVAVNETAGPSVACVVVSRSEKYPKPTSDAPGSLGGFDAKQFLLDNPKANERLAKALDLSDHRNIPDHGFACGLVIDDKGFVLTPHHVVEGATKIYVHLPGRVGSYADIHAADARHDLAVLRLLTPPPGLKAVKFADARGLRSVAAGKLVVIAENGYTANLPVDRPAAVLGSVTRVRPHLDDSVGDKRQKLSSHSYYYHGPFIEYSATLKPPRPGALDLAPPAWAASGAALLNLDGELIGLTTTAPILGHGDKTPGYAFPMDENVRRVIDVLRRGEEVEYGFLGVQLDDSRGEIGLGLVLPLGPAAQAGVRTGDVITHINDVPVKSYPDLLVHIGSALAGTKVQLTLRRGANQTIPVPLVLGKLQHDRPVIASARPAPVFGLRVEYDSILAQLVSNNAQAILENVDKGIPVGVSVRDVATDSPAATAFKKLGDRPERWLVTHLNGNAVTSPAEFYAAAKGQKTIKLTVIDPTEAKRPQREVTFP